MPSWIVTLYIIVTKTKYINAAASIWFKIWGSWIRVNKISIFPGKFQKNFDFFRQFQKFRLFQANFSEILIFPGKLLKNFNFFREFKKKFDFPGKNCSFTATSWQIILFLIKSHHFKTYFLYMIRYNNISRPPCQKSGGSDPPGLTSLGTLTLHCQRED